MSDPTVPAEIAAMSFEDALAELEAIVRRLEGGQVRLDDAIQAYERGAQLKRHCEAKLAEATAITARMTDAVLDRLLAPPPGLESRVYEAMRYSALAPGKRLRPLLVVAGARLFGVHRRSAFQVAAAIEMVHAYSLIHDDLPAMDNSDLRRGRPTCHIEFDEATAVLAGDGLLTMAFEVLAHPDTHGDPAVRCELVASLAAAAGGAGMVGGQMIDLIAERLPLDIGAITRLQRMKTGALIAFACEAGAILAKTP